ncbi:hypothetical protein AYL99_06246 [Fonsecaea erecta]|uniref:SP-RING-type domain-containing protein n=1 Tax=Fonsecaea erecta TaxID=1367422 RepID=A0A178ZGN0_9EURO|nr:hypothetical protein AYL99_06246 [Fonsecaea erecta]OAP58949.1 hypothetical protein AYL99_06246 [Fonsecaea erecta]
MRTNPTVPKTGTDGLRSVPAPDHGGQNARQNLLTPPTEGPSHRDSCSPAGRDSQAILPESSAGIDRQGDSAPPSEHARGSRLTGGFGILSPRHRLQVTGPSAMTSQRNESSVVEPPDTHSSFRARMPTSGEVVQRSPLSMCNLPESNIAPQVSEQLTSTGVAKKRKADTSELAERTVSPMTSSTVVAKKRKADTSDSAERTVPPMTSSPRLPSPHSSSPVSHTASLQASLPKSRHSLERTGQQALQLYDANFSSSTSLANGQQHPMPPVQLSRTGPPATESHPHYCAFVEDSVVLRECVQGTDYISNWNVHISEDQWKRKSTRTQTKVEQTGSGESCVSKGSLEFTLRSVLVDGDGRQPFIPTQSDFHRRTSKWPKYLAVSINEEFDTTPIPYDGVIDVTHLLREGDNQVTISTWELGETFMYLIALEITWVGTYEEMKDMPTRIPAADVIGTITEFLRSRSDGLNGDDLIDPNPVMGINLIDPLTPEIWRTPVRGRGCQHHECFDLEVFLSSRARDFAEGGLTRPDQWRCPICRGDARPSLLVIDEFLLGVRNSLEENNQLDARRILVKEGGSWEPLFGSPSSRYPSTLPS